MAGVRKYASFFEWHDKARKELGVVEELLRSLDSESNLGLRNPRINKPDPPDCICEDCNGNSIGVEVAELVCEETAGRNARGEDVMRVWYLGELYAHVDSLLKEKDRKKYHGGPYKGIVVCLFTDEPMLTLTDAQQELAGVKFGPLHQVTTAFLVFSYDPSTKSFPVITLQIAA